MLIRTHRHTAEDLERWDRVEAPRDEVTQIRLGSRLSTKVRWAREEIRDFIAQPGGGYMGVSWGKDSVVCAWLLAQIEADTGLSLPVVWVRLRRWQNPDSYAVRDAFLSRWPLKQYVEIEAEEGVTRKGVGEERLVHGFAEATRRFGDRHVSGVRAQESMVRRMSIGRSGTTTKRTCRPIGKWSTEEIFALIHREGLPLHPAYGYTMGGMLDRMRIRTANIGGERGTGFGRREWERRYYPDVFARDGHVPLAAAAAAVIGDPWLPIELAKGGGDG